MDLDATLGPHWYMQEQLAQQLNELTRSLERAIAFNKTLTRCVTPRPVFTANGLTTSSDCSVTVLPASRCLVESQMKQSTLNDPLLGPSYVSKSKSGTDKKKAPKNASKKPAVLPESREKSSPLPSIDDLKRQMRESLIKPTYHVEDCYYKTGFFQRLARNDYFNGATIMVIIGSILWLAYDTDNNKSDVLCEAPAIFQIAGNFFCLYFAVEITIRFLAFETKINAFKDAWFVFDSALSCLIVWDTWIQAMLYYSNGGVVSSSTMGSSSNIFRIFRVFRVFRVARMLRMMRSFPQLIVLTRGMMMALRSTSAVLLMLLMVTYVYSILFTQLLSKTKTGKGHFENVPMAMNFLLCQVVCGFDADFIAVMLKTGFMYYAVYLSFLLTASMTLMNMLVGILVDVVSDVAEEEKEELFMKVCETEVGRVMKTLDVDNTGSLSKDEFFVLTKNAHMMHSLVDLGVDIVAFVESMAEIYSDVDALSFDFIYETLTQFRGAKESTVKDIVDMRKFVSMEINNLESKLGLSRNDGL